MYLLFLKYKNELKSDDTEAKQFICQIPTNVLCFTGLLKSFSLFDYKIISNSLCLQKDLDLNTYDVFDDLELISDIKNDIYQECLLIAKPVKILLHNEIKDSIINNNAINNEIRSSPENEIYNIYVIFKSVDDCKITRKFLVNRKYNNIYVDIKYVKLNL